MRDSTLYAMAAFVMGVASIGVLPTPTWGSWLSDATGVNIDFNKIIAPPPSGPVQSTALAVPQVISQPVSVGPPATSDDAGCSQSQDNDACKAKRAALQRYYQSLVACLDDSAKGCEQFDRI